MKQVVENRLHRLSRQNPLRTDFQQHYETIVAEYNREKNRVTIERTFGALLELGPGPGPGRKSRGPRGPRRRVADDLRPFDETGPERVRRQADQARRQGAAASIKAERLYVDQWREKEATRDAVQVTIHGLLWSDKTGLPAGSYSGDEVTVKSAAVFRYVFCVYPTVPSPYYEYGAAA